MAATKSSFDSRLSNQTENNQKWTNEYIKAIIEEQKSSNTIEAYKNIIINFMEFNKNVDLNAVTLEKLKEFRDLSKSASRKNAKVYALRGLFGVVSIDGDTIFNINTIDNLIVPIDRDARKAVPLSIDEIISIRYALRNDYNRAYVFEMFYQYGLSLDEMVLCTDKTYDHITKIFHLTNGKTIRATSIIQDIIEKRPKVLNPMTKYGYKKRNAYQNNINDIGEKIGRQLTWYDLIETRATYFFSCHMCNERFEGIPENWALRQYEKDIYKTKWIVCQSCATNEISNE